MVDILNGVLSTVTDVVGRQVKSLEVLLVVAMSSEKLCQLEGCLRLCSEFPNGLQGREEHPGG